MHITRGQLLASLTALDSSWQARQSRQCCQAVKLDSCRQSFDSCRQLSTVVDSLDSLDSQGSDVDVHGGSTGQSHTPPS